VWYECCDACDFIDPVHHKRFIAFASTTCYGDYFKELTPVSQTSELSKLLLGTIKESGSDDVKRFSRAAAKILMYSGEELARACVEVDSFIFKRINPNSLKTNLLPQFFNRLAYGIESAILVCEEESQQVSVMARIIEMAAAAYDMNDFNVLSALVHGMSSNNIERLSHIRSNLSPSHRLTFDQLCKICNPTRNFACMRQMESDGE
jgi:hypothetical protein